MRKHRYQILIAAGDSDTVDEIYVEICRDKSHNQSEIIMKLRRGGDKTLVDIVAPWDESTPQHEIHELISVMQRADRALIKNTAHLANRLDEG
jgi:hypothetical protein